MKTLIIYATKHDATATLANHISNQIEFSVVHDLKQSTTPSIDDYDCIIVGSPVYAGAIHKGVKAFIEQNSKALCEKKLGLFLSGMDASGEEKYFDDNFSTDILQAATAKSVLGGIFDPQKAGFFERLIMKIATKQSGYTSTIDEDKIKLFAECINSKSV